MISGPKHLSNARKRLDAFRKTLRSERIALPNEYIEFGDFREHSGRIAAERLLSLETPPTAILVANNEMMAGALLAIRQRRVKVPRDLSVIGFDDARWAQYSDPPLTVISQPTEVMGQKAAELLLGRLKGEKESTTVMFKPELIIRGSTAAPRRS
jgi:LacI family transcriptional regulator